MKMPTIDIDWVEQGISAKDAEKCECPHEGKDPDSPNCIHRGCTDWVEIAATDEGWCKYKK